MPTMRSERPDRAERPDRPGPYDIVVIGAGPAGLAAAVTAARQGREVALIDGGARPGGQYWRHSLAGGPASVDRLGQGLLTAAGEHIQAGRIGYFARHHVWALTRHEPSGGYRFTVHTNQRDVGGGTLVLAPGAYDRQLPFPGWDLPGVFTAGGAQALLKEHAVLVGRRVVIGGTGPFLLPVAAALASAGATVPGVFEASSPVRWLRPDRLGAVAGTPARLAEGAVYAARLSRHRVPVRFRSAIVAAHGEQQVEAVTVARLDAGGAVVPGSDRRIDADALAVGWGFTPQLELPLALGCATTVDVDGSLVVVVNARQESSVPGVYVAGEATGVGGAGLAVCEGELAGRAAAGVAGPPPVRLLRRRSAHRAFAAAMHRSYPVPPGWTERLADDTLVCRCEEVDAGQLRAAVDLGAQDARTAKLLSRAGMGWCQGRVCGYATTCLTSAWTGTPDDPAGLAERPLATPLALGRLAGEAEEH